MDAKVAEGSKVSPEGAGDGASVRGLREGCCGALLLAETLIVGSDGATGSVEVQVEGA